MKMKHNHRSIEPFDIDECTSDTPPRRQGNAQQGATGYLWNSTTQELIPILPEDHPDYRQNAEIRRAAIDRWNAGISKNDRR
jgi:predicted amidohydrolase YtcJ